ncbi:hypothetical protein SAMN05660226_02006 [Parapedobacter luteus]|uniref:Uncharacterized protein n=1 Tax=Parapedobacter luteus TaxID=623280 RepID=A0A1T5CA33_9SPHI|nr:hypothetical protein SAMN05660226_02006 [Parapedobacter luteus]
MMIFSHHREFSEVTRLQGFFQIRHPAQRAMLHASESWLLTPMVPLSW